MPSAATRRSGRGWEAGDMAPTISTSRLPEPESGVGERGKRTEKETRDHHHDDARVRPPRELPIVGRMADHEQDDHTRDETAMVSNATPRRLAIRLVRSVPKPPSPLSVGVGSGTALPSWLQVARARMLLTMYLLLG